MHVRIGDWSQHDAVTVTLDDFVAVLARLSARFHIAGVVVASDDSDTIDAAPGVLRSLLSPDARVTVLRPSQARAETHIGSMADQLWKAEPATRVGGTLDVIDLIDTLSSTNVFIGLCSSQLARTIASLQYLKGVAEHAPVAIERDRCAGGTQPVPVAIDGWASSADLSLPHVNWATMP
jgi:hypothetical protein